MGDRYDWNRAKGVKDRIVHANRPLRENDEMAKAAENFFADRYGLPHNDRQGRRNAAFVKRFRFNGRLIETSIDVQWTEHENGRLIHTYDSPARATAYVLVIGAPDKGRPFRLVGWAWGYELHDPGSVTDLGYGKVFAIRQEELRPNVDNLVAGLFEMPVLV